MAAPPSNAPSLAPLRDSVVIFDLDGTLADTSPDLVRALNVVMGNQALPPVQLQDVRAMVGRGSRLLILRALARLGIGLPEPLVDAMQDEFLHVYAANPVAESQLFANVKTTLDTLKHHGAHMVVATNKPDALAHPVLEGLGIASYFERMIGADTAPKRKPHADHLRAAAGQYGMQNAVMIGDSGPDAQAAHNAGIPVILMRYGYSEVPMETLSPTAILDDFEQLPHAIARIISPHD